MENTQGVTSKKVWYKKQWIWWTVLGGIVLISLITWVSVYYVQRMDKISNYISTGQYEIAKKELDSALIAYPTDEKVYVLYADFYLAQNNPDGAIRVLERGLEVITTPSVLQLRLDELKPPVKTELQTEKTPTPTDNKTNSKNDTQALNAITGETVTSTSNTLTGYTLATANMLYDNVKIYFPDNHNIDHVFNVLSFSNQSGAFTGRVYVYDVGAKTNSWMKLKEIEELGCLIKTDDPALATAKRTVKAVEADNYMRPDPADLRDNMRLYSMNAFNGSMNQSELNIVKAGMLSTEVINLDTSKTEKVDTLYIVNNFYIKK